MNRRIPSFAQSFTALSRLGPGSVAIRGFAERWEQGVRISAEEFLAQQPELAANPAFELEVAYEEYCQRMSAGELVDAVAFCQRFPALAGSLEKLLIVHRYLQDDPDDWQTDEVVWPELGESFQGFELRGELGRGTFARVFVAAEPALGNREVVVKISLDGHSEALTLGRLRHDNIVPIHSAKKDAETGLTAICMPYHGAVTLEDVLRKLFTGRRQPLSGREVLSVCRPTNADAPPPARPLRRGSYVDAVVHLGGQLADALSHAHAAGICHRDLKPSNVLIDPSGRPLLLDFNLSSDPQAAERRVGGTLPYMPPEQIRATLLDRRADAPALDVRSDVYSLGVLLYEMLCGRPPFGNPADASTNGSLKAAAEELIRRQQSGPRPIRSLNPHVNARLARLVERCLAPNADDRPASAALLAAELRRANAPQVRATRWMRMHKALATAAAACVLFGVLAVSAGVASHAPEHERSYRDGVKAAAQGDFERAVDLFNDAIDQQPDYYRAWMARGYAHLELRDWNGAVNDFDGALERIPTDVSTFVGTKYAASALSAKAYAYLKCELPAQARASFDNAVRRALTPEGLNNYAVVCRLAKPIPDLDLARDLLNEALRQQPDLTVARYNRFLVELVDNSMTKRDLSTSAMLDILVAGESNPDNATLHYLTACGYLKSDWADGPALARIEVERAVERGWDPAKVLSNLSLGSLRTAPDFDDWYAALTQRYNRNVSDAWRASPVDLVDPAECAPW